MCGILKQCIDNEILPEDPEYAQVVTLFGEGDHANLENYRQTSLPHSQYKVYTFIVQRT